MHTASHRTLRSAGELKQRLLELAALDGSLLELVDDFLLRANLAAIIEALLALQLGLHRLHDESLLALHARQTCAQEPQPEQSIAEMVIANFMPGIPVMSLYF